jgi:hypothetical protein
VGVTGKGEMWQKKPPDAESAAGTRIPESVGSARTCPVHAVLGRMPLRYLGLEEQFNRFMDSFYIENKS